MNIQKHSTEMYSASLFNRLDELINPTEEDKIRWIMELIQNAKDSLFSETNTDNRDIIEISIEIKRDHDNNQCNEVIFTHNGPPFNEKQRDGLAYKNSSGKNNDKSTGKFGTGFVTVHVLSKTVYISGDIYKNGEIKSFSFTMCREGNNKEELEKNIYVTEKSYHEDNEPINLTQFKFPIQSDLSRKCVELGLIHFKKNIPNVLINCNNIGCINLIDNKNVAKYSASLKEQINESIYCYEVLCNEDTKNFLVVKDNEQKIDISIEIDANKYENDKEIVIIPRDDDKESLFITFPLIGSKAHILPFYINSPDFHPTTERNGLYLDGPEYINDEKTRICKNREILMKSVVLYEKLIQYVKNNGCSNIFELSVGLTSLNMPYKTFDSKWYNGIFLKEMRKVFSNIVTVKTFSGEDVLLKDACFPANQINDNLVGKFVRLSVTNKYYPNIVSEKDCLKWRNRLWEFNQVVSINDIIDKIHKDPSILLEDQLSSLNETILFISDYSPNILYTIPLVPDMNNVFKCIKNDGISMKKCQAVPDELIELMESLNIQWKSIHINKMITSLDISEDKLNDAENILIEKINSDERTCLNIMQYVLKDNETRNNMFDLINQFQINNIKWDNPIFVQNINPKIWESADSIVIDKIMQIISKYDQNIMKEKINIIAKFISVFMDHYKSNENIINSAKIIPNGGYVLKSLNDLYNKSDTFHDHFNPILKQYYNIDFDDSIIHPKINQIIKSNKNEEITDFLSLINQKISEFDIEKQIHIAESVISLVPQNDYQTPMLVDQNKIFEFYKQLINSEIKQIIIDDKNFYL